MKFIPKLGFVIRGIKCITDTSNHLHRRRAYLSLVRRIRTFYLTTVRLIAVVLTVDNTVALCVLLQKAVATLTLIPYFRAGCFWEAERIFCVRQRSKGEQAANAERPTLSAVELIPSVDAVFLTVAYKERMQRAAAPTVLHGSRCEKHMSHLQITSCVKGQGARAILMSPCSISCPRALCNL